MEKQELTMEELEIIGFLAKGHSKKYIAKVFEKSYAEILKQTKTICNKLNAKNSAQAVYIAMQNGYIH